MVSLCPNKVTSFDSVELPESEDPKNVVRVGWSTDSASLQLGTFTIIVNLCHFDLFYKHQQQCIQQGIGPRLLFYHDYFTDEHVRKELHMLHTMFLLADSCKIIWTLLLFCYSVSSSGEIKNSYGFDSSGKKALDSEFSEYGQSFGVDDVVGCYLVSAWTVIKSHSCSRSWNQTVSNKLLGNVKM